MRGHRYITSRDYVLTSPTSGQQVVPKVETRSTSSSIAVNHCLGHRARIHVGHVSERTSILTQLFTLQFDIAYREQARQVKFHFGIA